MIFYIIRINFLHKTLEIIKTPSSSTFPSSSKIVQTEGNFSWLKLLLNQFFYLHIRYSTAFKPRI